MASTTLEQLRQLHEELEALEAAAGDAIDSRPKVVSVRVRRAEAPLC
jgi:hypothetical protein